MEPPITAQHRDILLQDMTELAREIMVMDTMSPDFGYQIAIRFDRALTLMAKVLLAVPVKEG